MHRGSLCPRALCHPARPLHRNVLTWRAYPFNLFHDILLSMEVQLRGEQATKRATTTAEKEALRREGRVLAAVAHPGVVRLIGATDDTLVLERAEGGSLADSPAQPLEVIAAWGASVATTLADLHDIGWAHGDVGPDHVLFDAAGRPILCSFGRATRLTPALQRADVSGLARLIQDRLPLGTDRRLRRAAGTSGSGRDARSLARLLVRLADPPVRGISRRGRVVACSVAAVATTAAATGLFVASHTWSDGPRSVRVAAYVLSFGSKQNDVAVIGPGSCAPRELAVLDLVGGWIWVFDQLPKPATRLSAHLIGRVPAATGVSWIDSAGMCDRLEVRRHGGPPIVVQAER